MRFRLIECIFVVAIVASVMAYLQQRPATESSVSPAASFTPRLVAEGSIVPAFSLENPQGAAVEYGGEGPLLVVLTATGCQGCLDRIDGTDRQAYELAKAAGVPVWNMLVYQGAEGAPKFVEARHPSADMVLCDPKASVSVQTLGGSDATCWILLDKRGALAWRGPAEIDGLKSALAKL